MSMWNLNKQEFFGKLFLTSRCGKGQKSGDDGNFSTKWNDLKDKNGITDWKIEWRGNLGLLYHAMEEKGKIRREEKKGVDRGGRMW